MAIETIGGYDVDVQNEDSKTIKNIIKGWKEHESDFRQMRRQVDEGSDKKIYVSEKVVFEKKNGKYIVRKSSSAY